MNSGNAYHHSVQNPISYLEAKIAVCKHIVLPIVLYGCETWSATLREEHEAL